MEGIVTSGATPYKGNALDARLQWIRTLAAVLVVCLHSASELMYSIGYGSSEWWFVNTINGLARCSVPLFVMVSGALFLGRFDGFSGFYRRRLNRFAIPLVFWSIAYITFGIVINGVSLTNLTYMKNLVKALYNGKPYYHLWYLYMLVGLYLVVPFLQKLWVSLNEKQKMLLTVFCFSLAAIAPFEDVFIPVESGNPFFLLYRFLPYLGYFVCGRWLKEKIDGNGRGPSLLVAVLLMSLMAVVTIVGSYFTGSNREPGRYFFHYLSLNVIAFTILLFYTLMKRIRAENKPPRIIRFTDATSLAVYLIHPMLLVPFGYFYKWLLPQGPLFCLFITGKIVVVLAVSLLIGWVMMKVPGLRRTVC